MLLYVYFRKHTSQWTTTYFMFTSGFEQITCHQQYVITCWAYEVSLKNLHIRLFKWLLVNVCLYMLHNYIILIYMLIIDAYVLFPWGLNILHPTFTVQCIWLIWMVDLVPCTCTAFFQSIDIYIHLLHHVQGNVVCEDQKVHNILRKYGLI